MSTLSSRFSRVGLAAALAAGVAVLGAGTASAQETCVYGPEQDALVTVGSSHVGVGEGECGWLEFGMGLEGKNGRPNTISLGEFELPGGQWLVGFIDDYTGLYPLHPTNYYQR